MKRSKTISKRFWKDEERSNPSLCEYLRKPDCGCQCGMLAAELEGVKLDLLIINKNMESKISAAINERENDEIIQLKKDLFNERRKCKQLESDLAILVRGRNQEINDLNNTIVCLENKLKSTEASNESLSETIMRINSVKLLKSKQCGILPFLNPTKECDQINNDRIEVEAPVRDNMKVVCLKPNDNKPENSNAENERSSQPMAANVQASQEVNINLNTSLQLEKSPEGEISKVYSSDPFFHNPSGPNPSEGQNVKSHRKSILPNPRSLRQNTSWINSLPLIDTSCTFTSNRTQTRSRSNRTYSSKTTSCKKPNQYQATRQQPSQNRTRGFQLLFPKHNRLKHSVNQNFRRSRMKEWSVYLEFVRQVMKNK